MKEGGVVEQLVHQVELECPAGSIPDKLHVNVNQLKLNDSIKLASLELPEKSKIFGDPETIVVHCIVPVEKPEEGEAAAAAPGEPEVIGAKPEEETEES